MYIACSMTIIVKDSMKNDHKIFFFLIAAKKSLYLQPFMLVTISQPIDGFKRCCDWTSSIWRNI